MRTITDLCVAVTLLRILPRINIQMDKEERANAIFEQVWANFNHDKARLRSLSEKDKTELKALMKTIFMSSLAAGAAVEDATKAAQQFNLHVSGADKQEVERTVRDVVREELSGLFQMIGELKNRSLLPASASRPGSDRSEDVAVALHEAMFGSDIRTNIDDVSVEGKEVGDVKGSLEALRKLRGGK